MNDEERRLFRREMGKARDMLEDCYLQLRAAGLPQDDYLTKAISAWLVDNYDSDPEMMYDGYMAAKDKP